MPRGSDVRAFGRFVRRREFAAYFPQFRDRPVVPVFSSHSLPNSMVNSLTRSGIYALAMGDEAMQVLNLDAVRRRTAAGRPSRQPRSGPDPRTLPPALPAMEPASP